MKNASELQRSVVLPTEFTVYVRKEGKITIPKEVRDALSISQGDLVLCRILKVRA